MKTLFSLTLLSLSLCASGVAFSQTNVFDDIIAVSPNHNYLEAALIQEGLDVALQNPSGDFTVFAPDDAAFDNLATALGTDISGLLALPNLDEVLLYHVLGVSASSGSLSNGDIVTPLNPANTIKLTVTSTNSVYANHAMVNAADLSADNGIVHSVDAVLLPLETVVDIAIDNGFTSLTAAVIQAELLPALTDPFSSLTVFAPTNQAFDDLATALGTDINGLLALPNLAEVLTYHVLGSAVESIDVSNGLIATPLNAANTLKFTVTGDSDVFVNQAQVTAVDISSDNGVVHVIDAVVLPSETVVDIAIDNGFTSLTAAVIQAELLPALTDPFSSLTVFAPTNQAFDDLATALGTDINGLLALPNLAEVLTYHVLGSAVESTDVSNGLIATPLNTANTLKFTVTGASDVFVNQAQVTAVDISSDNGVVHVIDAVVLPSETVVDIAIDNGFTSLTAAVIQAELLPALTDPFSSLTVFAPTNQAFEDLASDLGTDLNGLLNSPNLTEILLYHVIDGATLSSSLVDGALPTLNGQNVEISTSGMVMVNSSNVILADEQSDNGVVHAIDAVLLPSFASIDNLVGSTLEIYPNPASNWIAIDSEEAYNMNIYDQLGQIVLQHNSADGLSVDISALPNGTYIVLLKGFNSTHSERLVVIK